MVVENVGVLFANNVWYLWIVLMRPSSGHGGGDVGDIGDVKTWYDFYRVMSQMSRFNVFRKR